MNRFGLAFGVALLVVMATSGPAWGHARSVSYSTWELGDHGARVTLRLTLLEFSRLRESPNHAPTLDPALAAYMTSRLRLIAKGEACTPTRPPSSGSRRAASRKVSPRRRACSASRRRP